MTLRHKVLGVAVLVGLLLWVADTVVDFLFFNEQRRELRQVTDPFGRTIQADRPRCKSRHSRWEQTMPSSEVTRTSTITDIRRTRT